MPTFQGCWEDLWDAQRSLSGASDAGAGSFLYFARLPWLSQKHLFFWTKCLPFHITFLSFITPNDNFKELPEESYFSPVST